MVPLERSGRGFSGRMMRRNEVVVAQMTHLSRLVSTVRHPSSRLPADNGQPPPALDGAERKGPGISAPSPTDWLIASWAASGQSTQDVEVECGSEWPA